MKEYDAMQQQGSDACGVDLGQLYRLIEQGDEQAALCLLSEGAERLMQEERYAAFDALLCDVDLWRLKEAHIEALMLVAISVEGVSLEDDRSVLLPTLLAFKARVDEWRQKNRKVHKERLLGNQTHLRTATAEDERCVLVTLTAERARGLGLRVTHPVAQRYLVTRLEEGEDAPPPTEAEATLAALGALLDHYRPRPRPAEDRRSLMVTIVEDVTRLLSLVSDLRQALRRTEDELQRVRDGHAEARG